MRMFQQASAPSVFDAAPVLPCDGEYDKPAPDLQYAALVAKAAHANAAC